MRTNLYDRQGNVWMTGVEPIERLDDGTTRIRDAAGDVYCVPSELVGRRAAWRKGFAAFGLLLGLVAVWVLLVEAGLRAWG